jgi:hypothetical protein
MKSAGPSDLDQYLEQNDARIRDELFEFLRIPSVSARSEHNADTNAPPSGFAGRSRRLE